MRAGVQGPMAEMMARMMGPAPAPSDLLDDIARHGYRQIKAWPANPTGYWNMAWLFHQATDQANALAKAHSRLVECLERAESAGHDVLKCVACIELAGSIIFGAGEPYRTASWNVAEVGGLLARFDAGTQALDEWAMGAYSRGESSCEKIVRHQLGLARERGVTTVPCLDRSAHLTRDTGAPEHPVSTAMLGTCSGCSDRFVQTLLKRCARCKDPSTRCRFLQGCPGSCSCRWPISHPHTSVLYCAICVADCGVACQKKHWKSGHRAECVPAQR